MSVVKEEVRALLERLPDDVSFEDVQYHLYVIEKVQNGLDSIKRDGGLTPEQVGERLGKWVFL